MNASRGLVVIHPNDRMTIADYPLVETGPNVTQRLTFGDINYQVYRYTLHGVGGPQHGYIASTTPPTFEERQEAGLVLFGHDAFGIERVEALRPSPPTPDRASA